MTHKTHIIMVEYKLEFLREGCMAVFVLTYLFCK